MAPKYFTLKELCYSKAAENEKIDNFPTWEIVENLRRLGAVLDELRTAWKKPIIVSSGYRSALLNSFLGGVDNSHHKLGLAADIQCLNMKDFDKFKKFVADFFKNYSGEFDQVIIEKNKSTQWIHISIAGNRRQIFNLDVSKN